MIKALQIIHAPNSILKKKAELVQKVDDETKVLIDRMIKTIEMERTLGLAANMVGLLKRILVINIGTLVQPNILTLINPEIINSSLEYQAVEESSLCLPGISAIINRPRTITVKYMDYNENIHELKAEDSLSTILQHNIDHLEGKIYLDHLSKLKADTLLRKMQKHMKLYLPHVHSHNCIH